MIYYGGCPILWDSILKSEISLSTTEATHIALSQAIKDTIPSMALIGELSIVLPIIIEKSKIHCTIFEGNNSCIELVTRPSMRPSTKHIIPKSHHFRLKVQEDLITVRKDRFIYFK